MKINQLLESLNQQQRSVPQLPAMFRPKKISVLNNPTDPRHPMTGYAVGANESADRKDPYDQGWYTGHRRGQDETACPYKPGTAEHAQWMAGYEEAQAQPGHYDESLSEDDVEDFLARGGKITQVKPNRGPRSPGTSLGSKHIGTTRGGRASSISGKSANTRPTVKPVVAVESITKEDIITKLKARLGDYLSDLSKEIKKDPDLIDKLAAKAPGDQMGPPVKTVTTDDGHEISIHGNEDDGFRVSIKNKPAASRFKNLDEAVMACEMYCARRRAQAKSADYVDEA